MRTMALASRKSTGNRTGMHLLTSSLWLTQLVPVLVLTVCCSEAANIHRLKSNSIQAFLELEAARRSCIDKPLEVRERQADAIFSGTVRDVEPPRRHGGGGGLGQAVVAVKRIIKGDRVVEGAARAHLGRHRGGSGRPLVVVGGIGDPRICASTARKFDTRIFLVRDDGHGNLVLNSSIVRLTLHNIDHADAVVHSQFTAIPSTRLSSSFFKSNRINLFINQHR